MKPGNSAVRIRVKGINIVRRYRKDGSFALYRYHRETGRQLIGEPGTPEFIESYAVAERSLRDRAKGTISGLIRRFEDLPEFADLRADTTQLEYRRKFKAIEREWGSAPIASFNDMSFRTDVLAWRDKIAKRARREADNLASALLASAHGRRSRRARPQRARQDQARFTILTVPTSYGYPSMSRASPA